MKKGKCKITGRLLLTSYFLFLASCFLLLPSHFSLLNAADLKKELTEIEKKLKEEKQKVKEAIKKEKSIFSELEKINRAIKKKKKELRHYDKRLSETLSKIEFLKDEITLFNGELGKRKKYLKERLRTLYKQQYGDIALILISAKDYQDLIRRSRYISLIAYNDSRLMRTYSSDIKELDFKKRHMETLKKELEVNKSNVRKKMKEMQTERLKKDKLRASIRSKRGSYEKMIKELKESSKKLRKMIKRLKKKKLPPSIIGKGFKPLRGRLPWPVKGKVIVPFGKYKDPKFNIPVFKNGIEIEANTGAIAQAVAGGRVVYADWFRGYGQLLIINHGSGYHSLYGNLSEIFHKTGDIIKKGTAVGKIGESELLDVPTLYFEIRYKGRPLDPMRWLKRKGITKIKKR